MSEKRYAFYVLTEKHCSLIHAIVRGCWKDVRMAEYVQEEGKDMSYHGSPVHETLTTLQDIETKEVFHHNDYHRQNPISFIPAEKMQDYLQEQLEKSRVECKKLFEKIVLEKSKQKNLTQVSSQVEALIRKIERNESVMNLQ